MSSIKKFRVRGWDRSSGHPRERVVEADDEEAAVRIAGDESIAVESVHVESQGKEAQKARPTYSPEEVASIQEETYGGEMLIVSLITILQAILYIGSLGEFVAGLSSSKTGRELHVISGGILLCAALLCGIYKWLIYLRASIRAGSRGVLDKPIVKS